MIEALRPLPPKIIHDLLVASADEAAQRMTKAWQGVNFHTLPYCRLSLETRVWEWLTGFLISLPIIGPIFWIFWQTFGKPARLSAPYSPETVLPPPAPVAEHGVIIQAPATIIPIRPSEAAVKTEHLSFQEGKSSAEMKKADWELKTFSQEIIATKSSERGKWVSRYAPDGKLLEVIEKKADGKHCHLKLIDPKHIQVKIVKVEKKEGVIKETPLADETLELHDSFPWVQQPEIGIKNFILSKEKEISIYVVRTDMGEIIPLGLTGRLVPLRLKKIEGEGNPGVVNLNLEALLSTMNPIHLAKTTSSFDAQTGILRKANGTAAWPLSYASGSFTVEFLQNNPLPAPAHP